MTAGCPLFRLLRHGFYSTVAISFEWQAALFTSGTIGLLIFPFITYVPSSGLLGDLLPKVSATTRIAF